MTSFIATDTGGTFTDLASYDELSGRVTYSKCLTNEADLVAGVMESMAVAGVSVSSAKFFKHGTTQVINTLIQRTGATTALVTTLGFRDVLEIARGNRPVPFALGYRRDAPLIPRELRFEVNERIDASGKVLQALTDQELRDLVPALLREGVQAIAISFLNAYLYPLHEERAADILREAMPGVFVSTGTSLTREWFEYERTSTVAANAYVGARMGPYGRHFTEQLASVDFTGSFFMMGSNGGLLTGARATVAPIALVESGPIGGCIGAAAYAKALERKHVIAFDMGGTTAKCALVIEGKFDVQPTYFVGGYDHGFPLRTPVIDIVEVGAGGGSIAAVDPQRRLSVGPRSAGSTPGPVAFGLGGTEPTVTDANLVLGRIGSGTFLAGKLHLDLDLAKAEIASRIAAPLGYDTPDGIDRASNGMLDLSTQIMAGAIKEITVERGHDIRAFSLMTFGGSGPLFGSILARRLRIPEVIIPPHPGNFSTLGMLLADARIDLSRTLLSRMTAAAMLSLKHSFDEMEASAAAVLAEDFDSESMAMTRFLDMRYEGQTHTVLVPFERSAEHSDIIELFQRVYRHQFGRTIDGAQCEVLGARLIASAAIPKPPLACLTDSAEHQITPNPSSRSVYFPAPVGRVLTPVWNRTQLCFGASIDGPAIIEEYSATTVLMPGDRATIGSLGEIVIKIGSTDDHR